MSRVLQQREHTLRRTAQAFDLVVVGGGANGCAIAWDAALRGVRVLLLEKEDFGWATSAWNSRLIHGGLKYLEKYDVKLVRESLREREWMFHAAPHLVRPLRFVLPFYERNAHSRWLLQAGLLAYDALSWDKSTPWHRVRSRTAALALVPGLNTDGLQGAGTYYDGQVEYAERLCVELAVAAESVGAVVLNHARVDGLVEDGGAVTGITFTDTASGRQHTVGARAVVNAAGPWVDALLRTRPGERPDMMGGTKGTHLVVEPFPGAPVDSAMYYEALTDGRPMMVIPWLGKYIVGATDVRFTGDLDRASIDEDELTYILHETNRVLPDANLTRDDVLWSYTGVRPLPYQASGPTGDITRRHVVHDHAKDASDPLQGFFSVIGGKLTTCRALAEDVNDGVIGRAGRGAMRRRRATTTRLSRLPGAQALDYARFVEDFRRSTKLAPEVAERLLGIYGTRAAAVEALSEAEPHLAEPVDGLGGLLAAEVAFAVREESAVTLTDIVARRILTGLDADLGLSSLEAVARVAASEAGWSEAQATSEVEAYRSYIEKLTPSRA